MTLPAGWTADNPGHCRSCGADIVWAVNDKSGRRSLFNPDGTSHFATCPDAKAWRHNRTLRKHGH